MASSPSPPTPQEILDGPALQAPSGEVYNFVNPPNIHIACYTVVAVSMSIAIVAVSIRMYTNKTILKSFNWEDGTLILGTAFYLTYTAVAVKAVLHGAGTHQWNMQVKRFEGLLRWINTEDIVYNFCLPLTRVSIFLQYLRVFGQVRRTSVLYAGCWVSIVCISIFYTVAIFGQIFACTPREKIWNPLIKGHCTSSNAWNIGTGAFNVLIDIILVLLPQHEIWKLQMALRKKFAISAVFLIALLACAACGIRLYYSIKLQQTGDASYYIGLVGIYAATENSIGIFCTCLPVFPKFFRVVGPKFISLYRSSAAIASQLTSTVSKPTRNRNVKPVKINSTWNMSSSPQSELQGTYQTLGDSHELITVKGTKGDVSATRLDGHELDGSNGIRITQTVELENSPALNKNVDLEGQKRIEHMEMGW